MTLHLKCIIALILISLVFVMTHHSKSKSSLKNLSEQMVMKVMKPNSRQPKGIKNQHITTNHIVIIGASYVEGWNIHKIANMAVVNKGISGETSDEMLNRFEQDVISLNPFAVVIWGCINDIFNANPEEIETTINKIKNNIIAMVKLTRGNKIVPILATELTIRSKSNWYETIANRIGRMLGKENYQDYINKHVLAINKWVIAYAKTNDIMVLDLHTMLSDEQGIRKKEYAVEDGTHISSKGYKELTNYITKMLSTFFNNLSKSKE